MDSSVITKCGSIVCSRILALLPNVVQRNSWNSCFWRIPLPMRIPADFTIQRTLQESSQLPNMPFGHICAATFLQKRVRKFFSIVWCKFFSARKKQNSSIVPGSEERYTWILLVPSSPKDEVSKIILKSQL